MPFGGKISHFDLAFILTLLLLDSVGNLTVVTLFPILEVRYSSPLFMPALLSMVSVSHSQCQNVKGSLTLCHDTSFFTSLLLNT